ncbi:vacuolar protein sorting-associated protein 62 [Trichoderma sp. SZMC 28014]
MSELSTTTTTSFTARWSDKGSSATRDGGFWLPNSQGDMKPVGSVGVPNYNDINGNYTALLYGPGPGAGAGVPSPVASPTGYRLFWKDEKSGADKDGSFWRPIPPSGYVALGDVCQSGWSAPSVSDVWCVRSDLVKQGSFGSNSIWDDTNSGAQNDVSIWEIRSTRFRTADGEVDDGVMAATYLGPIRGSPNYDSPGSSFAKVPDV